MGISAGGSGRGPKNDINVTPLVDVVLVLLIIFIVTMPVLLRHITIEVPRKLDADEMPSSTSTPISVLGKADGTIELDDGSGKQSVNRVDLAKTLRPMIERIKSEKVVFVDFECNTPYGDVIGVMDTLKSFEQRSKEQQKVVVTDPVKVALKIKEPPAGQEQTWVACGPGQP
jgi:biopolymer transport protein ExbD